ncbi:peptidoglycan recognition protein [Aeromicrobium sp. NPDC092404]|uniref:peptidoglycan recognition protein n=1 Tax=Aeromicrobium sp. NPDC092404 TaxID=3154976 RepID=UPI003431764F
MRPFISGSIAALVLSALISAPSHAESSADLATTPAAAAEPVDVGTTTVPAVSDAVAEAAERADDDAADLVAQLPARRTGDFGLVGVTWERGFEAKGMTVQVRLRTDGSWSDWEELHVESDEGEGGRDGTEPLWAGSADGVAVRVTSPTGERPKGLSVATIDPGTTASSASTVGADSGVSTAFHSAAGDGAVTQVADGSPAYTGKPSIISRSGWGARKNTYCDSPRAGNETRGIVVHHTAGTNSYSKSQSPGIVRAVQAYHMKGRDWCDIGYNFLVDKYGQIFEGRNGGTSVPVRGAHAGVKSVNTYTMGVSMMGTFSSSEPSSATKSAMVRLIGWRLGTTFHPATGTYKIGDRAFHRIAGHRNVVSTACPGAAAYAWLSKSGGLRDRVSAYVSGYTSSIKTRATFLGSATTGPVFIGETIFTGGRKARLQKLDLYASTAGTFSVANYFRTGYNALKAQSGILGMPASEAESTAVAGVQVQRFARGSIHRVFRNGRYASYAVWQGIDAKYRELGEAAGELGRPTKTEASISGGRFRAYFEHGYITRSSTGVITVTMT